jgi:hypothetical protein
VTAGGTGNGSGPVLYSVAANPGSAARVGTMTIAGQTFTVNQDPQVPAAPSNLAAAAMNSTKVELSWDDNAGTQDSPLERHTTYVYRVMACNSAGCSAPSAEVSVTTPAYSVFIGEER